MEKGCERGCIKHTHLLILFCILSDPRLYPDIKYSVPDRQRWHVTHELHAVAYADDWPPTVKLIPRAFRSPDHMSAPFRIPWDRMIQCGRLHASAHTSPSWTGIVKHFDFARLDDFSARQARVLTSLLRKLVQAKSDNVSRRPTCTSRTKQPCFFHPFFRHLFRSTNC